jgi:hypothetical protein
MPFRHDQVGYPRTKYLALCFCTQNAILISEIGHCPANLPIGLVVELVVGCLQRLQPRTVAA